MGCRVCTRHPEYKAFLVRFMRVAIKLCKVHSRVPGFRSSLAYPPLPSPPGCGESRGKVVGLIGKNSGLEECSADKADALYGWLSIIFGPFFGSLIEYGTYHLRYPKKDPNFDNYPYGSWIWGFRS